MNEPGLEGLDFGRFWRFAGFYRQELDGAVVGCHGQVMRALAEGQRLGVAADARVRQHRPGGGGLALHLLTVPHFDGAVVGRRGKDGVLVRHSNAVDGRFVLVEVGHQKPLWVPPCNTGTPRRKTV